MLKIRSELLEFVERSETHKSLESLIEDFSGMINRQGFGSFIMTGLPSVGTDVEPLVIANHWPVAWADRYREQTYFPDDPISKWSLSQDRPFLWREALYAHANTKRVQTLNGEARSFGLVDGIAFPMRSLRNWQAVVSLASSEPIDIDKREQSLLYTAAIYFQMAANELIKSTSAPPPQLTPREREILTWTAAGKTPWEISVILSLAESTTRNHIAAVHRKLNVSTTTQAVIEALRSGQIHV
jgi:LuxR family quorum sensing-dependent transcriptional regulator